MTTATAPRSGSLLTRPHNRAGYEGLAEAVIVRAAQDFPRHDLYMWMKSQTAEMWFGLAGYARGQWLRKAEPAYREWAEARQAERSRRATGQREARRERRRRGEVSATTEKRRDSQLRYRLQDYYRKNGTLRGMYLMDKSRARLQRLGSLWLRQALRESGL